MIELSKKELNDVTGGGISLAMGFLIGAGIVFLIGLISGYVKPRKCDK